MSRKITISHRGNLHGPEKGKENLPETIDEAISRGLHVEIDIWVEERRIYLGHDAPATEISLNYLKDRCDNLWIHCKNTTALTFFLEHKLNVFYHDKDLHTLTSEGYIWSRPGFYAFCKNEILVLPEKFYGPRSTNWLKISHEFHGVCTDFPLDFVNLFSTWNAIDL